MDTTPQETGQFDLDRMIAQNAQLAKMNELLREKMRLTNENKMLSQGISPDSSSSAPALAPAPAPAAVHFGGASPSAPSGHMNPACMFPGASSQAPVAPMFQASMPAPAAPQFAPTMPVAPMMPQAALAPTSPFGAPASQAANPFLAAQMAAGLFPGAAAPSPVPATPDSNAMAAAMAQMFPGMGVPGVPPQPDNNAAAAAAMAAFANMFAGAAAPGGGAQPNAAAAAAQAMAAANLFGGAAAPGGGMGQPDQAAMMAAAMAAAAKAAAAATGVAPAVAPGSAAGQESETITAGRRRRERRKAAANNAEKEATGDPPAEDMSNPQGRTTVMLRNLPNNYNRTMLLAMLDSEGFKGQYNFLYLPVDFKSKACLGYAFVNLITPEVVPVFHRKFEGFSKWALPSRKVCAVSWSGPHQGLEEHIERYRNSPVMHDTVPEEYKPLLFERGVRMAFPPPSKNPQVPRVRNLRAAANKAQGHGTGSVPATIDLSKALS